MQETLKSKPIFDKADLMERLDDDLSLAMELTALFVSDVREKINALQEAIRAGNGPEIEKEAHSLKGAAANLSAERVRYLANLIEVAGKTNRLDRVAAANMLLLPAVEELIEILNVQIMNGD